MDATKVSVGSSRDDGAGSAASGAHDTSGSDSAGPPPNSKGRKRGRANKDDGEYSPKVRKRVTNAGGKAGTGGTKRNARKLGMGQEAVTVSVDTSGEMGSVSVSMNPQTGLSENGVMTGGLTA